MIQLKKYAELPSEKTVVLLLEKGSKVPATIPSDIRDSVKSFLKSEEKMDFYKSVQATYFFIKAEQHHEKIRIAGHTVFSKLTKKDTSVYLWGDDSAVHLLTEGLILSSYQFLPYFTDAEKRRNALKEVYLPSGFPDKKIKEIEATAKAVFWVRDRVNEPVSHLNSVKLAEHIAALGKESGFSVQILEKTQIESLKMGGLLAVNKGSIDPPTFTIAEYKPANPVNKKPVVLVGKGIVYDTGGLSLKPTPGSMDVMKSDMAGAATVIGALYLAALQKLKVHIVVLVPSTDNRPGGNAYAPGDVITMFNGKTVEVLNTDAEGRMILADALSYSEKFKPALVIDAATLTGAAVRAIGTKASIVMGNAEDKFFEQLEKSGEEVYERVVRFPFWDEYAEEMKSTIADLKNIGGPYAGMITAGKFLEHFVTSPYIHMDIAGPSWLDGKEDYKGQGGTGTGVRLLYTFLKKFK
jgi:leucyl aminopeptidase